MNAARRPEPTAVVISVGPETTSPAAKSHGSPVWSVTGSASTDRSRRMPIATIAVSQASSSVSSSS